MKIKLRRDFQGQDSWGAFVEEVGIDEKGRLTYRRSTGGNCDYGKYEGWQGENRALTLLLGPVRVTKTMKKYLVAALSELPDLEELTLPNGYGDINYGKY